jgi:hypothetical protein
MAVKFETLTNNSKILRITVPLFTPVTKNPDAETDEQIMSQHEKFLALPETVKDKLACVEISEKIQQIGKAFNLKLLQLADISRAIRSYYFGELKLEDMPFILAKEMNIDLTRAREITQIIISKIINDRSQEEIYASSLENLTIPEALKKYPFLEEQAITANNIKIQKFQDLVKPSIKNWINDYKTVLGQGIHSSVERSNYLFHSKNAVALSSADRQKLAYLLKCLDENIPVSINKTAKQIVFPNNSAGFNELTFTSSEKEILPKSEAKNNIQSVEFSYPQKMTFEKTQPIVAKPVAPIKNITNDLGPNVVNLKD